MASTLEIIGELHINIQSMHDINHGNPEIDLLLHEMSALINELQESIESEYDNTAEEIQTKKVMENNKIGG